MTTLIRCRYCRGTYTEDSWAMGERIGPYCRGCGRTEQAVTEDCHDACHITAMESVEIVADLRAEVARLRLVGMRWLRVAHLEAHPSCRPGPVEQCPDERYRRYVKELEATR